MLRSGALGGTGHAPAKEHFAQRQKNKSQIDWGAARRWGPPGARDCFNLSSGNLSQDGSPYSHFGRRLTSNGAANIAYASPGNIHPGSILLPLHKHEIALAWRMATSRMMEWLLNETY